MNSLPLIFFLALVGTSALYSAETFLPGLVMELRGHSSDSPDFRLERRAALRVDLGEPPSAFLDPGPFEAVWRGVLCLDKRERLFFSFEGFGKATLLIGGEIVLEAKAENLALVESPRLRLNGGRHQLELRYSSSPVGTGRIRLFWRGRDFARESTPPKSLKHPLGGTHYESLLKSTKLRKGRFLAAVSGCLGCHVPEKALELETAMPEAFAKGPSLRGVGSRLNELWMAKWILDPHAISPLARMPKLVSSSEESAHLAAFLASLKEEAAEPKAFPGDSNTGKSSFVELGCIVCHRLKEDGKSSDSKRIMLAGLHQKYLPGALRKFLLKPGKHYLWTRMPDFQLTVKEATDLASFLRGLAAPPVDLSYVKGDAAKGKVLASTLGCAACHDLPVENELNAPTFAQLAKSFDQGCLGQKSGSPRFVFAKDQHSALSTFLLEGTKSFSRHSPPEFAVRQFEELHCAACHQRDGSNSLWGMFEDEIPHTKIKESQSIAVEQGFGPIQKVNRTPPDLTFLGEKLREDWVSSFFSGKFQEKTRPWLKARMPSFPVRSNLLAKGFSRSCGVEPLRLNKLLNRDVNELNKAGVTVVNTLCITCHAVGERQPTAVFEGQGVNLVTSRKRMLEQHYMRWMLNPYRINQSTIMPKFADDEGRTGLIDVFGGDAHHQFEAVWQYLRAISK